MNYSPHKKKAFFVLRKRTDPWDSEFSEVQSIDGLRERMAKSVTVRVNLERVSQDTAENLQRVLEGHPGEASVIFELEQPRAYLVTLRPNQFVKVKPSAQLVQEVENLCGAGTVKF